MVWPAWPGGGHQQWSVLDRQTDSVCVCGSCCCVVSMLSCSESLEFMLLFSSRLLLSCIPPIPLQDRYQFTAVTMLLEYLADSPVAPLQAALIEVPEPFCAEISESVYENSEACVGFSFSGVPTDQLPLLEDKYVHVCLIY